MLPAMRTTFRATLFTTALAVILGLVGVTAPRANAIDDLSVSTWANDVTVYKGGRCKHVTVRAEGDWSLYATSEVRVRVRTPGDKLFYSVDVIDNATGEIRRDFRMCFSDPGGRYEVTVSATAFDDADVRHTGSDTSSFRVDKVIPKKGSRLAERHGRISGEGRYKFVAVGTLFRSGELYPSRGVWLVAKIGTYWYKIDRQRTGRRGEGRGRVAWLFKPNDYKWAFYFAGNSTTKWSASDPFRFPRAARLAPQQALAEREALVKSR